MEHTLFIGIDVSKDKLDVCILSEKGFIDSFVVKNSKSGYEQMLSKVKKRGINALFCMEATGSYHYGVGFFLLDEQQHVSVENPATVKYYGLSVSAIQKTDKADAKLIARYAKERKPQPWKLSDPKMRELLFLSKRIDDINKLTNQESNRLENESLPLIVVRAIKKNLKNFAAELKALLKEIQRLLAESEELKRIYSLLVSIPGVALRSAIGFMASFPDLTQFATAEQIASACGLNPRLKRSGSSVNGQTRISKRGSAHMRKLFYLPALVAIKHNPVIKSFYEKLVAKGKPKKSALIACERKLLMICYGVVKSGRPFSHTP